MDSCDGSVDHCTMIGKKIWGVYKVFCKIVMEKGGCKTYQFYVKIHEFLKGDE